MGYLEYELYRKLKIFARAPKNHIFAISLHWLHVSASKFTRVLIDVAGLLSGIGWSAQWLAKSQRPDICFRLPNIEYLRFLSFHYLHRKCKGVRLLNLVWIQRSFRDSAGFRRIQGILEIILFIFFQYWYAKSIKFYCFLKSTLRSRPIVGVHTGLSITLSILIECN